VSCDDGLDFFFVFPRSPITRYWGVGGSMIMEEDVSISRMSEEPLDKTGREGRIVVPVDISSAAWLGILGGGFNVLLGRLRLSRLGENAS